MLKVAKEPSDFPTPLGVFQSCAIFVLCLSRRNSGSVRPATCPLRQLTAANLDTDAHHREGPVGDGAPWLGGSSLEEGIHFNMGTSLQKARRK